MLALLILMLTWFWLILGGVELFKYVQRRQSQRQVKAANRIPRGALLHLHR